MTYTGDIVDDDDTFGKFTQPDLLLVTNGILPSEEFPITSRSKPRPLHMNSFPNRDRQFQSSLPTAPKTSSNTNSSMFTSPTKTKAA